MLLVLSILIISAIAKALQDLINFKGISLIKRKDNKILALIRSWVLGINEFSWYKRTWLLKYPLSFISNGWHLMDAIRNVVLSIAVVLYEGKDWYWVIGYYIFLGIIFEIIYNIKKG